MTQLLAGGAKLVAIKLNVAIKADTPTVAHQNDHIRLKCRVGLETLVTDCRLHMSSPTCAGSDEL